MFRGHKGGNLSSTPSLLSIASSADLSFKEESLPNPTTLAECDDLLETHQLLLQGKSKEKVNLINSIKQLREEKEPLLKVKATIQKEISKANQLINIKSEDITHLRQKLRHHSEKQINDNIERLEVQLRNNNYKPREEQKILDEICMLKRSFKTLREFELKQKENKKLRSERSRLIDQRNEVFSKIQAIIFQGEEMKKEISELRHIITASTRTVEHLKALRPELERAYLAEIKQKEEIRQKRIKEKIKAKKEQYILRQQERQKRWEEYEASREPYEDEKDICKMLMAYLRSALPSVPSKAKSSEKDSPKTYSNFQSTFATNEELKLSSKDDLPKLDSNNLASPSLQNNSNLSKKVSIKTNSSHVGQGSFYCKSKDEPSEKPRGKKKKARARKEQKAGKIRELSHPLDVLANLESLNIAIPRTTEDIPSCLRQIEIKLEHFALLGKKDKELLNREEEKSTKKNSLTCAVQPSSSLPSQESLQEKKTKEEFVNPVETPITPSEKPHSPPTSLNQLNCSLVTAGHQILNTPSPSVQADLISGSSSPKSFFSIPLPVVRSKQPNKDPSFIPTYASVAAKVHV